MSKVPGSGRLVKAVNRKIKSKNSQIILDSAAYYY